MDNPIDDLTLERLEDNGAIARDELGLAVTRDDHALANVRDGHDGDYKAELAGAGAFDVGIKLRLEVLLHARSEIGRVKHDRVRELFLQKRMGHFLSGPCARAREGEGSYDEEHRRGGPRSRLLASSSSLLSSRVASRAEEHDDKDIRGARLTLDRHRQHHHRGPFFWSLLVSVPMLQGLALRTVRLVYRVHPRPVNALGRPVLLPLVSGGSVPAAARHYAQTPPGGQGSGGGGGFPGFKFPMQQQYAKGDALKEFVRALLGFLLFLFCFVYSLTRCCCTVEQRLDRVGKVRKA